MTTPTPPVRSRREGGIPDGLLLFLIGFLLGITVLLWAGTGIAGLLAHGRWPHALHFTRTPQAMRELVVKPTDVHGAWPQVPAGDLPRPGLFWGIFVGELLVLLVLGGFAISTVSRARTLRAARTNAVPAHRAGHTILDSTPPAPVVPRQQPPAPEPTPVPEHHDLRSDVPLPAEPANEAPNGKVREDEARLGTGPGEAGLPPGQLVGSYVLFTGARSDHHPHAVQSAVLDAEGPVLVTCSGAATWRQTVGVRAKLGPVLLFDPEHLVDAPDRLRWAPHSGCEDPATATARARALLAPLRTHDITADDAAATLLRCWLHAAAVDGLPFRQLHRWAAGSGSADAVRILRTARDVASGWSGELEATLHAHPERRETAQGIVRNALSGLNSVHIRDACSPGRGEALDLESFVNERGTLYVVGEPREDPRSRPGAMPLLTALVSSVVEHGRRMAEGSSPGRLDPPMTCVLDEVATVAPLPELPSLMSQGPACGICVLAVLRSEEQARHRWPSREAPAIWRTATGQLTADA